MQKALHLALLALFALAAPATAATATPKPPAAIAALAQATVNATNSNDATKLAGLYTNNAVVVDELDPFAWTGTEPGVTWCTRVKKELVKNKATGFHATAYAPSEYMNHGSTAYLIVPMKLAALLAGKPFTELGTMTYTFAKVSGVWKISSQIWTTKP